MQSFIKIHIISEFQPAQKLPSKTL